METVGRLPLWSRAVLHYINYNLHNHRRAYGNGRGGLALLTIPLAAALMCAQQCVAANARMLFAFSRCGMVKTEEGFMVQDGKEWGLVYPGGKSRIR